MARIRTTKPGFWSHPIMGRLDGEAKCLALALLNFADDEGYFFADPAKVRSECRPFDDDSKETKRCLDACVKAGWVEIRQHGTHGAIGLVVNFSEHQQINRAHKSSIKTYFDSSTNQGTFTDASRQEGNGKEGKGREIKPKSDRGKPLPHDFCVTPDHRYFALARDLPDPDKQIERFRLYWMGNQKTKKDWNATFKLWLINEKEKYGNENGHGKRKAQVNQDQQRDDFRQMAAAIDGEGGTETAVPKQRLLAHVGGKARGDGRLENIGKPDGEGEIH